MFVTILSIAVIQNSQSYLQSRLFAFSYGLNWTNNNGIALLVIFHKQAAIWMISDGLRIPGNDNDQAKHFSLLLSNCVFLLRWHRHLLTCRTSNSTSCHLFKNTKPSLSQGITLHILFGVPFPKSLMYIHSLLLEISSVFFTIIVGFLRIFALP